MKFIQQADGTIVSSDYYQKNCKPTESKTSCSFMGHSHLSYMSDIYTEGF